MIHRAIAGLAVRRNGLGFAWPGLLGQFNLTSQSRALRGKLRCDRCCPMLYEVNPDSCVMFFTITEHRAWVGIPVPHFRTYHTLSLWHHFAVERKSIASRAL